MAISKDLFLAILAMDSYNRGYGSGLGSAIDGLGSTPGTRIGNAVVLDADLPSNSETAGFYAVAYQMDGAVGETGDQLADGQTVISYRGTDNVDPFLIGDGASDLWQGWISGAGLPAGQSALAFEFYTAVTDADAFDGVPQGVVLTGHSLGGGLAGVVGAISGDQAIIFDAMPYAALATGRIGFEARNIGTL